MFTPIIKDFIFIDSIYPNNIKDMSTAAVHLADNSHSSSEFANATGDEIINYDSDGEEIILFSLQDEEPDYDRILEEIGFVGVL